MRAYRIPADVHENCEWVEVDSDEDVRTYLEGKAKPVNVIKVPVTALVREDGRKAKLPTNLRATFALIWGTALSVYDAVYGDMLIVGHQEGGFWTSVPDSGNVARFIENVKSLQSTADGALQL